MMKKIRIALAVTVGLVAVSNAHACGFDSFGAHRYSPFDVMSGPLNAIAGQTQIDARALDAERARRNLAAKLTAATSAEPGSNQAPSQQPAAQSSDASKPVNQNQFR